MAVNEAIIGRIRTIFFDKNIDFVEKSMFGGCCFMVDDKMCCGTHTDKKTGDNFLLCRIGEDAYEAALEQGDCIPMEFTGKPMRGYVFVTEAGYKSRAELEHWLQLCLDYNPMAKKSKKK